MKNPVSFTQFAGIRNTVSAYQLRDGELADAKNVDINDEKRVLLRPGATEFNAGAADSLYSNGDIALFRRSSALRQLLPDGSSVELLTGVDNPLAYWSESGLVYFSDGVITGVYENGSVRGWGIIPPASLPVADQIPGALPTGRYMFTVTYLRDDDEESGTGKAGIAENITGGLSFSSIPQSSQPGVTKKALYLSRPNGDMLYRAMIIDNDVTSATYDIDIENLSVALDTKYKQPPPACSVISNNNGRMLVGADEFLLFSDPYRLELFDPLNQSYRFDSALKMIAPVEGGTFIGTEDSIIYMSGDDIAKASPDKKAAYGAIKGTLDYVDGSKLGTDIEGEVAIFATQQGVCLGGPGGSFVNLTKKRYSYPESLAGAGLVRLADGKDQYIAALTR